MKPKENSTLYHSEITQFKQSQQHHQLSQTPEVTEEQWEFFLDQAGKWKWLRMDADGIFLNASKQAFDTYGECVGNAIFCGYCKEHKVVYVPDLLTVTLNTYC